MFMRWSSRIMGEEGGGGMVGQWFTGDRWTQGVNAARRSSIEKDLE
jgi:hypothetical protein